MILTTRFFEMEHRTKPKQMFSGTSKCLVGSRVHLYKTESTRIETVLWAKLFQNSKCVSFVSQAEDLLTEFDSSYKFSPQF